MPKTHWNYRVLVRDGISHGIHEVHYRDGVPVSCSEKPIAAYGESPDDLRTDLELMREALDKPVLQYEAF